ncbi:putative cytochrome P450 [Medicago truncatula]|uniref:Putative cytochrome P450 n=1 Tax=Medicago truncatula TaxID=3880 RepID=A0A396JPP5_MEDTR|nr:putative cytochrome P450 [Medicago truncatula]
MLPALLRHLSNFHDHTTLVLKHHGGTFRFEGAWFTNTGFIGTSDPMNVNHIASKNFSNYGRGSNFQDIFYFFQGSILNSHPDVWKQQRAMFNSYLKRKTFMNFFQQTMKKKLEKCLLPFLNDVSEIGAHVDLEDVFSRFTFDSICTIAFGFDPNCLPNKFNELRDIAYQKSLPVMDEVIIYRHFIPSYLWKLQKWLNVGHERKLREAEENLDRFLYESITFSKQEQCKCSSSEEMDDFLKALTKEGSGKGEMDEKYLRDNVITLFLAGNGPVSSALSWFFWLVSTHPIVEAKIIQEIKDNCPTQEENQIPSRDEYLDKLVYLHGAICETLRLYPPVPFEHICSIKSDILPSGERISPNTRLLYSLYAMGRMEQIWGEDCMEFKPERWVSERGHIIHVPSYKFIAFNQDLEVVWVRILASFK